MATLKKYMWIIPTLLLLSCGANVDKAGLAGKWKGVSIDYKDKGGIVDASRVYYDFKADGTYVGTDASGDPETGTYKTLLNMLYLQPKGGKERAYELESQTAEELIFNINPGAIPLLLTLKKG